MLLCVGLLFDLKSITGYPDRDMSERLLKRKTLRMTVVCFVTLEFEEKLSLKISKLLSAKCKLLI